MAQDNALWDYAVSLYSVPECAALCLALQNEHGLSVNRLLFALWLADQDHRYPVDEVLSSADDWQQSVLNPLRRLRYELRGCANSEAERLCYEALKEAELKAEKVELERLRQRLVDCLVSEKSEHLALDNLYSCLPAELEIGKDLQLCLQQLAEIATQFGSN